jgi:hypothetical protein
VKAFDNSEIVLVKIVRLEIIAVFTFLNALCCSMKANLRVDRCGRHFSRALVKDLLQGVVLGWLIEGNVIII